MFLYQTSTDTVKSLFNKLHDGVTLAYLLKQDVRLPTRGSVILDKIHTNMQDWYKQRVILLNIGWSDHNAIVTTAELITKDSEDRMSS